MNTPPLIVPSIHHELASLVKEISHAVESTPLASIARTNFGDLAKELEEMRFRLAVLGPWNSGKSCLVNRLIGELDPENGLMPVADKPTTAKVTYVQYGEFPALYKAADGEASMKQIAKGEVETRKLMKVEAVAREKSSLRIEWPVEFCRLGGELVDTPGLFDPDEERSMVTLTAMERFHAVVFVVPCMMPINPEIVRFVEEHLSRRTKSKFFYLINKIDQLDDEDEEPQEQVEYCYEKLVRALKERQESLDYRTGVEVTSMVDSARFFGVSALRGDGLEQACGAIRSLISKGAFQELSIIALERLDQVLRSFQASYESAILARSADVHEFERLLSELIRHEESFLNIMKVRESSIPEEFKKLANNAGKEFTRIMHAVRKQGMERLEYSFWEKLCKPGLIRRELMELQRDLSETAADALDKIHEDLRCQIKAALSLHDRDFVEPTTRQLRKIADNVDKALIKGMPAQTNLELKGAGPHFQPANAEGDDEGSVVPILASGTLAGGAGAGVVFGTGMAWATVTATVGTQATVVSTAASWVPIWVAHALGYTATISTPITTTSTVMAGGAVAAWIAGPAAAAVITALAVVNMIKSSRSIKDCRRFLDNLPEEHGPKVIESLTSEMKLMGNGVLEGMRSHLSGIIERLRDHIMNLKECASGQKAAYEECVLQGRMPQWSQTLDLIRENINTSNDYENSHIAQ